ncbi:MAG: metallophosphoesterase [Amphiplicatus sp.]
MGVYRMYFYYAAYLYFLAAPVLLWLIVRRKGLWRYGAAALLAPLSVLAYARFVEPRILLAGRHDIALSRCFDKAGEFRLAVFSDTHIGIFGNEMPIGRIVRRVNAARPDLVFIAGDFAYLIEPARLDEAFAPLARIAAPVYAVLGNHDIGEPAPDISAILTPALEKLSVEIIDDKAISARVAGDDIGIVGISDLWGEHQKRALLDKPTDAPRLVLTHNPSLIRRLGESAKFDLMIAGHTHGGQIYLPFLTCRWQPGACDVTRYGLAETPRGPVFVTSGTGMVGLAMRFLVPPRIDVLTIRYNACAAG